MVVVKVDSREWNHVRPIIQYLKLKGYGVEKDKIEFCDFIVDGNEKFIIERKTIPDLMRSMSTMRLWFQLDKMKRVEGGYPILVVEFRGTLRGFKPPSFYGLLISVQKDWGVDVVPSLNRKHTAVILERLCVRAESSKSHRGRLVYKPKAETVDDMILRVVASLPNVGSSKAVKLMRKFKTIINLVNASVEEIMEVEDVGEKTARMIYDLFRAEYRR